jgi:hypothetical protein
VRAGPGPLTQVRVMTVHPVVVVNDVGDEEENHVERDL